MPVIPPVSAQIRPIRGIAEQALRIPCGTLADGLR
jgi:hypothetical protein